MQKNIVITAAIFICVSIILGALAAHSLEKLLSQDLIETFEKGVKYLIYSGFGLLIIGLNKDRLKVNLKWFYILLLIGTILFSGNIFLYVFHETIPSLKNFVHLVPIGGLLMILAWAVLILKLIRLK